MAIFIGEIIRQKAKERKVTVTWMAKKLGCHRTNIYRIFDSVSIDTNVLYRLSSILKFDFFKIYSDNLTEETRSE
ncbi:MAG: helix-turn-helix transcriptional regulator [Bacteroidales bacterium]|nr:helix-turn-helix transcriptional regulator [Bacteroidales bacterium]